RISGGFSEQAAAAHGSEYWRRRAAAGGPSAGGAQSGPGAEALAALPAPVADVAGDPGGLGPDLPEAEVRRAFDDIRARELLKARRGSSVRISRRPGIRGQRLVLEDHLVSDRAPAGMRYVRGVDLLKVLEVAPRFTAVPDGWVAYNASSPAVALPDYLTALSVAFAAGLLEHDPIEPGA
ncbi:MAG TPA: hypothetical protein VLA09_04650, partial [Longimicrobiales bacterium]|nr:hypothetical protein [Longimicrobiales bacterium]